MSSFVVKENWGGSRSNYHQDRQKPKGDQSRFERQGRVETEYVGRKGDANRSWLSGRRAESDHHEPPKCQLKAMGYKGKDLGKVKINLTLAEHALFHLVRGRLFESQVDFDTATAITCRMSPRQNEEYEEIVNDVNLVTVVETEILTRQRIWGVKC